ncbi:MAG: glycoside hydrolase family 68 protein [Albidovulum sp.]|nr:glycoside hydrolase family 68 protein [Albidovulum sp.]
MLALKDKWIWDFWLARRNGLWHIFFLQAPNTLGDPELRHWNVSQGHAVSEDLVNWKYLGVCFGPSATESWDDYTTWTGSVVQNGKDDWHLFYTGTSKRERGLKQRIGHATSTDLHNWRRVGDGLALDLDPELYEEFEEGRWHDRAMRDPWVMRDPEGEGWLMFFTARVAGHAESNEGGAIGLAESSDLENWTICEPIFTGSFGQLEVPQVFSLRGKWYCLFCTHSYDWAQTYRRSYGAPSVTGTHYLIGDSCRGPWKLAGGKFLDGQEPAKRYAGKVVQRGGKLYFLGFLDRNVEGGFVGAVSDPIPVECDEEGRLELVRATEIVAGN